MNWKSITPAISMSGQVVRFVGPKSKPLVRPAFDAAAASWSVVTPFANFGRFVANCSGLKNRTPNNAMSAQPAIPMIVR